MCRPQTTLLLVSSPQVRAPEEQGSVGRSPQLFGTHLSSQSTTVKLLQTKRQRRKDPHSSPEGSFNRPEPEDFEREPLWEKRETPPPSQCLLPLLIFPIKRLNTSIFLLVTKKTKNFTFNDLSLISGWFQYDLKTHTVRSHSGHKIHRVNFTFQGQTKPRSQEFSLGPTST